MNDAVKNVRTTQSIRVDFRNLDHGHHNTQKWKTEGPIHAREMLKSKKKIQRRFLKQLLRLILLLLLSKYYYN